MQTLVGLQGLCVKCHGVKHAGLAMSKGLLDEVHRHLAAVNEWSVEDARLYLEVCFEIWAGRSGHEWTVDLTWLVTEGGVSPSEVVLPPNGMLRSV